jgi:hypothetical protein
MRELKLSEMVSVITKGKRFELPVNLRSKHHISETASLSEMSKPIRRAKLFTTGQDSRGRKGRAYFPTDLGVRGEGR